MDLRLLLLCKEHVNDYISATEAENAEGMRRDFAELHKLGFVELNNLNQGLAAALALLRQLYLRYHEVVGLSFLKIDLFQGSHRLIRGAIPSEEGSTRRCSFQIHSLLNPS